MSNALITIVAPLDHVRLPDAQAAIERLGNPAGEAVQRALDASGTTHFASMHAFASSDGARGYIILEFSADGPDDKALAAVVTALGEHLRPIFMLASDWSDGGELAAYMKAHRVAVGGGWFDNPGVVFAGTPDMTVARIRSESHLAARITALLAAQPSHMHALERVEAVRQSLATDPTFAATADPADSVQPFEPPSTAAFALQLVGSFAKLYLWPLGILILAWALYVGFVDGSLQHGNGPRLGAFLLGVVSGLWTGFWASLVIVLIAAGVGYALLRQAEDTDSLEERASDRANNAAMFARENRYAQNHMISVTQRKPGAIRWFTARLVFWVIGEFAARFYPPGFLSDIGTIHFARWVTPPGSPDVIFFSNYGGSWESYLEDFITRAHAGLTAVWSNSIGFPRTENLFQNGATDGERFKRYARHSMIPTRFWYSAYPNLTTTAIRTNAEIRRGLSGTMTEDEARRWLSLFGSAARPISKLMSNEIQSLIFGGLGFMQYGTCLVYELPQDIPTARQWLKAVYPHVAFNDGRRLDKEAVVSLALAARGLARLGLPAESLDTFPFAFVEGMATESRARILGDMGANGPEGWRWGQTQPDAALLVYGHTPEAVADLEARLLDAAREHGLPEPHRIPLRPVQKTEPFGFADGISQPVIRGTHKALRSGDPIHVVEPGEFILGYPDNRGNMPPGPTLPAIADPTNHLPLLTTVTGFGRTVVETDRDIGFNGSFLVIRELEQDVHGFAEYCQQEAEALNRSGRLPNTIDGDFVAAKLVGRWKDGASLVRHPIQPPPEEKRRYEPQQAAPRKMAGLQQAASPSTGPSQSAPETARLMTNPGADKASIMRPLEGSVRGDNDFLFGTEDPDAIRCPFGSHIRRSNPRDSLDPGSNEQISITNRHRIIRVGRQYEPHPGQNPGLLFMCLNGDIERQFEFLQQTWLRSPSFHGLSCEKDPLLGDGEEGACSYTIPSHDGPLRLSPMRQFVTTRGGGYFFLPGRRLIEFLGAAP